MGAQGELPSCEAWLLAAGGGWGGGGRVVEADVVEAEVVEAEVVLAEVVLAEVGGRGEVVLGASFLFGVLFFCFSAPPLNKACRRVTPQGWPDPRPWEQPATWEQTWSTVDKVSPMELSKLLGTAGAERVDHAQAHL